MGHRIKVIEGDITSLEVDAIVNPANSYGYMGGGVAYAIKRAGGGEIEREAVEKSPINIGKAIVTTAGKLKAQYVIHAPTMRRPAERTDVDNIKAATRAALKVAEENNIMSIAFPGMGTGVGGVDEKDAARVMIEEIKEHLKIPH